MNGKDIELTRRRVLGGVATIGAASAAAGAGTFAYFSDTEESTGNTIQAGTLDLLAPSNAVIGATNIVPGWGVNTYTITSTYDSASTVDPVNVSLEIALANNDSDGDTLTAAEFGQKIKVTTATLESTDSSSHNLLNDHSTRTTGHPDGNSYYDLDQVATSYTDIVTASPGDDLTLTLDLEMPSNVGNNAQGEGVDIDVTFTAKQQ